MFHRIVLMIVFAFAVGLVGCRSCWGPYDSCQPTFVPEAGDHCMGELYRNGSILGGMERTSNNGGCATCAGTASTDSENIIPANHTEYVPAEEFAPVEESAPAALPNEIPLGPIEKAPVPSDHVLPEGANFSIEQYPLSAEGSM